MSSYRLLGTDWPGETPVYEDENGLIYHLVEGHFELLPGQARPASDDTAAHDCHAHVDNQGLCHTCGRPVESVAWLAYHGGAFEDFEAAQDAFGGKITGPLPLSSPWADAVRKNRHRVRCAHSSLTAILGSGVIDPDAATFVDHDALEMLADELERAVANWERRAAAGKP